MNLFAFVASVTVILHCVTADLSDLRDERSSTPGSLSTGGKIAAALTPLPQTENRQYYGNQNFPFIPGHRPSQNKKCPLCDSSVYPYCGEKLLHDACCCTDPYIHQLPYQCKLADCRFLHSNSCREHRLIANCCCSDDYRSLLKSFAKL